MSRVELNPSIMLGKPVIQGTRITVESILRKLGEGISIEEILDVYPQLKVEDIYAAINYGADLVAGEESLAA